MTAAAASRGLADSLGRGVLAGIVGTAAMTLSSTVEAKLNNRSPSTAPADAASAVVGVEPTEEGAARFNNLVHWAYGSMWGALRGVISLSGVTEPAATLVHLGAVWGSEQVVLPQLKVGSPVWKYGAEAVGTDLLHHTVYAVATGLAYDWLNRP